jgi:hypothetical protein
LSDNLVDDLAGFEGSRWAKAFALSCVKMPTLATLMKFADVLGLSVVLVEDPEKVRRVRSRWEGRQANYIHDTSRLAQASIRRALPHAQTLLGIAGGKARWEGVDENERRQHMQELARRRWA